MTHIRTLIRQAATAQIKAADTAAEEERVFEGRLTNYVAGDFPACAVYTLEESGGAQELGAGAAQKRGVSLTVECAMVQDDGEDDADFWARLDGFCEEVETAISDDPTLGGVAAQTDYQGAQIEPANEGAEPTLVATLIFSVGAMNKGAQLTGGRLSAVTVDGVAIGRLQSWGIEANAEPADVTHSGIAWRAFSENVAASWTATVSMTLDDDDPGQALLGLLSKRDFVFHPRGPDAGQPAYEGAAIVSAISEDPTDDGDVIRVVTITGNGSIS